MNLISKPVAALVWCTLILVALPVRGAVVTASFSSIADVPVTAESYIATGNTVDISLGFAPPVGTNLTVVKNTGTGFIQGTFGNLVQGQVVNLTYGRITYRFVVNYYGGTGNDLELQWANTRLLAWGGNSYGQLGNNTTKNSSVVVPVDMTGVLASKTVIAISAGDSHSIGLCSDGTLAAWGHNSDGQLGNNSNTQSVAPKLVDKTGVLLGKTVIAIAAGTGHSLVLCSDGTLAAWGDNAYGQLGNGSRISRKAPVLVNQTGVLASKKVVAIDTGNFHSLALCSDGTVAAWGAGFSGQLGNNSRTDSTVPVAIDQAGVLLGKSVTAVVAGGAHNLALCTDGTVAAWGYNYYGQLGINSSAWYSYVPVLVDRTGVLSDKTVIAVLAGGAHNLALCSDGTIAGWGSNASGELGNNSTIQGIVPVLVDRTGVLLDRSVTAMSAGTWHNHALCSDGTLAAWGYNNLGQLGNNSTLQSSVPVTVCTDSLITGTRFLATADGTSHSLALAAFPLQTATTQPVTALNDISVTLNGSVNANGNSATVLFEYGPTDSYGSTIAGTPAVVSGVSDTSVHVDVSELTPGTTYHYRVVTTTLGGVVRGTDMTFTPSDNPDGDNHDNLIEYAFNLPPDSGAGSPFSIKPSTVSTGRVELTFTRPVGATTSVTYVLEYSRALGTTASWISIPLTTISPKNIDVAAIDELTERVTIRNLEAREGFVRFRVELDANGDQITDDLSYTGVQGWTESAMKLGTRTYNNPYQHEAVFTGTVDATGGVTGQALNFTNSAGTVDLGTLFTPGASYYLEVTAGTNEGQRFDVLSASGSTVILATTSDVCSDTPPFNTLAGALPATLGGNRIAIHRHWTLGDLFPVGRFRGGNDDTTADQVQTSAVAEASTYWLFANSGSPRWVKLGDNTLADQANTVLAPGHGMMVLKRGSAAPLLAYGEVRSNNFIRPLCAGLNLVGGGWPIVQSATGPGSRQMDVANGFSGGTDPGTSDTFSVWKGDATPGATGYDNYYLYNPGSAPKWVRADDVTLASRDAEPLFLGDRSVLIQVGNDVHDYTIPNPLNAVTQSVASMQGPTAISPGQDASAALIDYAFGLHLDPNNTVQLPQGKLVGDNYVIEFNQPAGVTGITYGAECSATLLPGSWTEVPDTGTGSGHIFSVPLAGGQLFMRLRVTGK